MAKPPPPAEHLRVIRHVTKRHDLVCLNAVACRELLQNPALVHGLRAHLDERLTDRAAGHRHQRTDRLMHARLQNIRVHAGHTNQVLNDRS